MKAKQPVESSKANATGRTGTHVMWPFPTNPDFSQRLTSPPLNEGDATFEEMRKEAGDAPW